MRVQLLSVLLLFFFLSESTVVAQHNQISDRRELRGVWLTTLLGLDWPHASLRGNIDAQKKALLDIFDDLNRKNFNVVFFQVRSRGNAMYCSSFEPWCSELTGVLGKDPGWDPLAFAITEAHARGLELHAWFNVFRVWSAGMPPRCNPPHPVHAHPSWVKKYGDDLWIDPGIPEAREYTVRVMEDLVRNYNVDGIHFDYCRYAERGFNDEDSWRMYGPSGMTKDDWRRGNINALVTAAYKRLSAIRPTLIIGSAPIGIYQNLPTARGWEGRNAIFQDSRAWLASGYHDYVVPQIYWGLTRNGSRIDFEALVADWSKNSFGRHVYPGIAAYKDNIKPHLAGHIDAVRSKGGNGMVFFRYDHIRDENFSSRFLNKALCPPLTWKDSLSPNPVRNLQKKMWSTTVRIDWETPLPAMDGDTASWYAVMERNENGSLVLRSLLPADVHHIEINATERDFTVFSLDRARNLSADPEVAFPIAAGLPSVAHGRTQEARLTSPVFVRQGLVLLACELPHSAHVRLRLLDDDAMEVALLHDGYMSAGVHVLGVEVDMLESDATYSILETGNTRIVQPFIATRL